MAVFGDAAPALTPYGMGATIEHLARGGHKLNSPFMGTSGHSWSERYIMSDTVKSSAGFAKAKLEASRSQPSLTNWVAPNSGVGMSTERHSGMRTPKSTISRRSSSSNRMWEWDDLQSVRSITRDREVSRIAKCLESTKHASIVRTTPLGVTQNLYYRREGLVHGSPNTQAHYYGDGPTGRR